VLCDVLIRTGAPAQAAFVAAQTTRARGGERMAALHEAKVLALIGRGSEAVPLVERAGVPPADEGVVRQVVTAYVLAGRADRALAYARGLGGPAAAGAMTVVVGTMAFMGKLEDALRAGREFLAEFGPDVPLYHWVCLHSNYSHALTEEEVSGIHREAGRAIAATAPAGPAPRFEVERDPGRRLRIAYVSQDFRNKSAGHFIESILRAHDRGLVEPFLYGAGDVHDEMTRAFFSLAARFDSVLGVPDAELAARMRRDRIDIAVDLTGHTGGNRLVAFAHHPAPVTVTYMGYANTTGLPGMQNRIVDSITDPPGSECWATERLIRIDPCFLCYAPPAHAPPVAPARDGPVTFGSFGVSQKITPAVLDVWARIAALVPTSRFLFKNRSHNPPSARDYLRTELSARGVAPDRVTLWAELPAPAEHLAAYSHMDIMLDTFPYTGTTTTVEALLMGVPVVTLRGHAHRARVSASLLSAVGLHEFVADDADAYVRTAGDLASDRTRLAAWRRSLRPRLLASPLCDRAGFTRKLEGVYRDLWREWCGSA
jgi:predicted O-linked N-acetylglucosamine transferase (SPINDLY family)